VLSSSNGFEYTREREHVPSESSHSESDSDSESESKSESESDSESEYDFNAGIDHDSDEDNCNCPHVLCLYYDYDGDSRVIEADDWQNSFVEALNAHDGKKCKRLANRVIKPYMSHILDKDTYYYKFAYRNVFEVLCKRVDATDKDPDALKVICKLIRDFFEMVVYEDCKAYRSSYHEASSEVSDFLNNLDIPDSVYRKLA
jgi:hypothetical protein